MNIFIKTYYFLILKNEHMKEKKFNFEMVFYCKDLNIELRYKAHSALIQKTIDCQIQPRKRVVVNGYHTDLFEELVHLWEDGNLVLPGKNNFESLGHFIFKTFEIRCTDKPDKKMQLKSIITEIYKYKTRK